MTTCSKPFTAESRKSLKIEDNITTESRKSSSKVQDKHTESRKSLKVEDKIKVEDKKNSQAPQPTPINPTAPEVLDDAAGLVDDSTFQYRSLAKRMDTIEEAMRGLTSLVTKIHDTINKVRNFCIRCAYFFLVTEIYAFLIPHIWTPTNYGLDDTDTLDGALRRGAQDGEQGEGKDGLVYFSWIKETTYVYVRQLSMGQREQIGPANHELGPCPVPSTEILGREKERIWRCLISAFDLLYFFMIFDPICHVHRCPVLFLRTKANWGMWSTSRTYKSSRMIYPPPVQACVSLFR